MIRFGAVQIWLQSQAFPKRYQWRREADGILSNDSDALLQRLVALGDQTPSVERARVGQQLHQAMSRHADQFTPTDPQYRILSIPLEGDEGSNFIHYENKEPIRENTLHHLIIDGPDIRRFFKRLGGATAYTNVMMERMAQKPAHHLEDIPLDGPADYSPLIALHGAIEDFIEEAVTAHKGGDASRVLDLDA